MSRPEEDTDTARQMRGAVLAILVAAVVLAFLLRAVLETPSGEGVGPPPGWARHERSEPGQ